MFGINLGLGILGSYALLYIFGHIIPRYQVKVNYTRKIYHFFPSSFTACMDID